MCGQLRAHAGTLLRYLTQSSRHAFYHAEAHSKGDEPLARALLGAGQRNPMKIPRKHILVVESDDNSVEMLRLYLGHFMYRVTAADTCGECLQLARTEQVDLYLLGDGCEAGGAFELCRKIRALDSNTPIIFCSADASPADRHEE